MGLIKPDISKMLAKKDLDGLVKALGDSDPKIVWDAAIALGKLKHPQAGDEILKVVENPKSRKGALRALGFISEGRALPYLIEALKDSDANIRQSAAFSLPMMPNPKMPVVLNALIGALKDADQNVRWEAATGLAMLKDKHGFDYLIDTLKHGHSAWKVSAARALGDYGDAQATSALIYALNGDDSFLSMAAAEALGKIKDPNAVEPLRIALKDKRQNVRLNANTALEAITGETHFVLFKEEA